MDNLRKQVDMYQGIARFFKQLLRLLIPARGRHRRVGVAYRARRAQAPDHRTVLLGATRPSPAPAPPLRGEDSFLVRPYLRSHEEHVTNEDRLRQQRRQALWFATFGIDLDTRDIHWVGAA